MTTQIVKLVDRGQKVLAITHVAEEGDHFGGTIDLGAAPASMRSLFNEFEEIVNGQMFSLLDEIQAKISTMAIRAVFEGGCPMDISDLQVYPSTGEVSFKIPEKQLGSRTAGAGADGSL